MKLKTVTANDLAVATTKVLRAARKQAVIVRTPGEAALILRPLVDDDAADDLLVGSRTFRASIRAARRRRVAGKGITLAEARRRLKL